MNIDFEQERKSLVKRQAATHKGDYGHVCIIGGGHAGYSGAVCLAGAAALRCGAGLVSAIVHPSALLLMNRAPMELMCYSSDCSAEVFNSLIQKATVIVLGSGLTQSDWALALFNKVINRLDVPIVLDADGLNILAQHTPSTLLKRNNWILTPHPGEAARLLGVTPEYIQNNRLESIKRLEEKWGGVVILKGMETLVYAKNQPIMKCSAGNPGMATGGMGDLLAGLIGGLLAQGLNLWAGAKLGVIVHAMAGDHQQMVGQRGMLASDLLVEFRALLN